MGAKLLGRYKWSGGVLAADGNIYGIPYQATQVLRFDPRTQQATLVGDQLPGDRVKWQGGVLAADGNIYGIPSHATQVLCFDPGTQQATRVGEQLPGDNKWSGGVLAADGNIYGIPSSATQVLRFGPPPPDTGASAAPGDYASGGVSDAPSGTVVAAAASVRWPDKVAWVGGTDFSFIDHLFGALLPLSEARLPLRAGALPFASPTAIFQDTYDNFSTIILATVFVGGWRSNWAHSFVSLILASYTTAELLALHAVKGGGACDCEIAFIEAVMPALGFTTKKTREMPGEGTWEEWLWIVKRPNARPFKVQLERYMQVGDCDEDMIADDTKPEGDWKLNACAPHLIRAATVSAPVVDKQKQPIADQLNTRLVNGLVLGRARAAGTVPADQKWKDLNEAQIEALRHACGKTHSS